MPFLRSDDGIFGHSPVLLVWRAPRFGHEVAPRRRRRGLQLLLFSGSSCVRGTPHTGLLLLVILVRVSDRGILILRPSQCYSEGACVDWEADWVALWLPVSGGGVGVWIVVFSIHPGYLSNTNRKAFVFRVGRFRFRLKHFSQLFV